MSHFSVLVITKDKPSESMIDELLFPFDENRSVPLYVQATKEEMIKNKKEEILNAKKMYEEYLKNPAESNFNVDYYKAKFEPFVEIAENDDEVALYLQAIEYLEEDDLNENGDRISTYNPDSKWDWYQIGGRFSDVLPENCIQVKDFPVPDNTITEEKLKEMYPEEYQRYIDTLSGKELSFYNIKYLKSRYPTFKSYMQYELCPTTFAVIDISGEWHEAGTMGYFGMSSATPEDEINWEEHFYDRFIKDLPKDYWLTLVDCHI